ncbi:MAG: hypothetical protein UY50_C0024G0006 [Parcubacteria group bacterium GW2011_GWA2_49_9]|nr:MAG: hypothetical protein UY50_C0024G0006 [Parcubacteria group bacterium GW2011_GWA2_49_9]
MYDNHGQGGYKGGNDKKQFGGPKQLFSAICADCRKPCQVPFRPSGDKPIYCKDCFMKRKEKTAGDTWRSDAPQSGSPKQNSTPAKPQPSSGGVQLVDLKRQMDVMSEKLDALLQKLEGVGTKAKKSAAKKTPVKKEKKVGKGKK